MQYPLQDKAPGYSPARIQQRILCAALARKIMELNTEVSDSFIIHHASSKKVFSKSDLDLCVDGSLFGTGSAQLPSDPLLMLDRIVEIQTLGGEYDRGYAIAELDIDPSKWFFKHHFRGDPVMPGCFLSESLWQLTGFYLAWAGHKGLGRVLDGGRTRFMDPVNDCKQTLRISIHIRKIYTNKNPICITNGDIQSDGAVKCRSETIKVGLF